MRKITKRTAAVAATAVLAVGGFGAAAWAAGWFKGSGQVNVATGQIKSLSAIGTVPGTLFPGKTANTTISVTNPNEYPVTVTGIENITLAGGGTGCTLQSSAISAVLPNGPKNIANGGTLALVVPLTMGLNASEACASKNLEIKFDLAGEVAAQGTATSAS